MAISSPRSNFKTSHVIVYPKKTEHRSSHNEFQNISCYCLSIMKICSFTRPELFQNISCYRLSDEVDTINFAGYIFQNISCYCLSSTFQIFNCFSKISKHLMLLFITSMHLFSINLNLFQNISCYCLSRFHGIFR